MAPFCDVHGRRTSSTAPNQQMRTQLAEAATGSFPFAVLRGLRVQAADLYARRRIGQAGRVNGASFGHSNLPILRVVLFQQPRALLDKEVTHAWLVTAAPSLPSPPGHR